MKIFQTAKQTPVSLPEICAPRAGLMGIFDNAASKTRYIYVHSPAGYGKTISTLLWIKKNNHKTIWISLDPYDNTLVLFYRLFCMSILSVVPHDAALNEEIKSPAFNAGPVEVTIDILSRLSYEDCKYALVFDDFHLITNDEIKKSLPFVLKRLPVTVTTIVLSRNNLSDSVIALYGHDTISIIGVNDLILKSDEIRKHFSSYGRFITREEAQNIYEYTGGWIIALNAMAASGSIDVTNESQSLSFSSFIEKNIWNKLDPALQEFLIKTSIPDKFSLELCECLTGSDKCAETIDALNSGNISITLDGEDYCYHSLILEFIRKKSSQSNLDIKALNKIVAEFYLKKGEYLTAKRYAAVSGDINIIMQTVRSFYELTSFPLDEYIEFHKLYKLHVIPDVICDKIPLLYIPRIFLSYANGDVENTNYLFDRLYPLLPEVARTNPESIEHLNGIIMLDCRIKLSEFSSRFNQLPTITHEDKKVQSPTFTYQLPFLHRCVRDFYELADSQVSNNVAAISSKIIKHNVTIMFKGAEAGLLLEKNKLHEALEIALSLKNAIADTMCQDAWASSKRSLRPARDAWASSKRSLRPAPEFVYALYVLLAEIYLLLNQRDHYESALREVKEYISETSSQYLLKNLSAYEAKTAISNGEKAAAEEWLKNYYVNENSFKEFYKIFRNFTTARAYILLMQTDKAWDALNKLRLLSENYDRPLDNAEAEVLLSIVEWITGKKKEARDRLLGVLVKTREYGFIRVIANEGKAVLPILSSVIKKIEKDNELSTQLHRFAKEVYILSYEHSRHFKGITNKSEAVSLKLSPQQKRILEFLAKGHRNTEIVDITGLSLNTIRTHTKAVYQKLEVNNVMDAISRAKQLKILE